MTRQSIPTTNQPDATEGKVGYKRPPVKSRFRKGQSGNPSGRRKGQRNMGKVLAEVLRQTVTVKQDGESERMSKGEALIQMLLTKANKGDNWAIRAVLELSEKIGRIQSAELKLGGLGNYEFMLIPGMAASAEEWQREIDARHETADLREAIAAARAATGTLPTGSQIDALRETIARASGNSHTPTQKARLLRKCPPPRQLPLGCSGRRPGPIERSIADHLTPQTRYPMHSNALSPAKAAIRELVVNPSLASCGLRPISAECCVPCGTTYFVAASQNRLLR